MNISLGQTRTLPSNAAGEQVPDGYDITPPDGEPTIKLFGWLRAYADYDAQIRVPGDKTTSLMRVSQSIYESDDGWWVGAEVTFRHRDNLAIAHNPPTYSVLKTRNKHDLASYFVGRDFVRALLAEIEVEYVQRIGGHTE